MLLEVIRDGGPRTFRLVGELDLSSLPGLEEEMKPVLEDAGDLLLDLSDLEFMDSSGVGFLVRASQALEGRGRVVLISPGPMVQRLLDLTRIADGGSNLEVRPSQAR